ncbi:hypothetical protein GGI26_003852 [Coemansia sp. RSA 1358]|uniref:Late embryogenesis abundant protein LEA-2 subgroup domain-containing protein n=1 Tax=Coemansia umbellata TaxID=1424467 RepID=A0ABQ8PPB0_9FUNG|nr:hypothetical protein EDC05_003235 [Coemansia umbellata]KAJ2621757.1 hypothetical protein GGI26_003852 [Coemansia sp. RSA 1358]
MFNEHWQHEHWQQQQQQQQQPYPHNAYHQYTPASHGQPAHPNPGFVASPASSDGIAAGHFFSAHEHAPSPYNTSRDSLGNQPQRGFYMNQHPESNTTAVDHHRRTSSSSAAFEGDKAHDELLGDEKQPPAKRIRGKRRCCGGGYICCCTRKCCLIFIPILLVILAALGVTLYFVWPRIPTVTFDRVAVAQASERSAESTVQQLVSSVNINRDGVVTVPLIIHLNVTNPNLIPWTIHNVTVDGFLKNSTAGGTNFPVGTGGLHEPFKMAKKSADNDMPLWFNFRLDTTNNSNYMAAAETVQQACTAGGPNLRFYYSAKVILKAISWLGIKPTISDTISFACPFSDIESLGINISDLTGLTA